MDNLLTTQTSAGAPERRQPAEIWELALAHLQAEVPKGAYDAWFGHARGVAHEADRFTIEVPSMFALEWLRDRYRVQIEETLSGVTGRATTLQLRIAPEEDRPTPRPNPPIGPPPAAAARLGEEHRSRIRLNPRYTFESFVVGGSNEFAHAACKAITERPGTAYNPVFIYGGVGLGKTHLIQAIGHAVLSRDPRTRVFYMSAEAWMNEMVFSIQNGTTLEFKEKYRNADFLLLDDIPFLAGKESTQQELFHTFNVLIDGRKQIVLTSDRPPHEIADVEERLISRFQAGLVADVQSPDLETRLAILRKRAAIEQIDLDDSVTLLIASSVKSNIRELEGSLVRLLAFASLTGRDISLELARQVLKDYLSNPSRKTTVEEIQSSVIDFFNMPADAMRSKRRTAALAHPRQIAMFLARELTGLSLTEVGRKFGGRDHTTVLHACDKIRAEIDHVPTVADAVSRIRRNLQK